MRAPLGWNVDDLTRPEIDGLQKASDKNEHINELIHATFSTPSGKEVLSWLRENTIEAGTWLSSLPYEKAVAHGFAREGQNSLVRDIELRMKRHQEKGIPHD